MANFPFNADDHPALAQSDLYALLDQLGSPIRRHREEAVNEIVDYGSIAVQPLIDYVSGAYRQGRNMAVRALGKIADPAALPALGQLLHDDDEIVRSVAAWALGQIGDAAAIPALTLAAKDRRACVRRRAEQSLAQLSTSKPSTEDDN